MRAKFPKPKPKNYPRPPIGGTSRRIGHQRGSFGNRLHPRNRPGRILNEGAAARKDTTDNELLGIISKKIVGGVGAPKQNTLRIADKVIDYDNIGSKFINVVAEDSKFGKKPAQTKKHHRSERMPCINYHRTNQHLSRRQSRGAKLYMAMLFQQSQYIRIQVVKRTKANHGTQTSEHVQNTP